MRDDRPWLSIVTVVKDDAPGLARTRESLLGQNCDGVQWVIVDSSTESDAVQSTAVAAGYDTAYAWAPPAGVYAAMNHALGLCEGQYVWFVNAGDEVQAGDTLDALRAALGTDPLWLIGQVAFIDPRGTRTVPPSFDYARERASLFARGRFAPHQGTVVRTAWLRDHGGFRAGYTVAADYEASLRLSEEAAPLVLHEVLAVFHVGGLSASRWRTSVAEFHRARRTVLKPKGVTALREWMLTGFSFVREAAGAALRRRRPAA